MLIPGIINAGIAGSTCPFEKVIMLLTFTGQQRTGKMN
jgi:hypothetical protein